MKTSGGGVIVFRDCYINEQKDRKLFDLVIFIRTSNVGKTTSLAEWSAYLTADSIPGNFTILNVN